MAILPGERMQYFDVETKTWKTLPVASPSIRAIRCFCAVSVCDKLMVTAQDSLGYCIYRYDTEANVWENEWEVKATTSSPQLGSILIVVKSKLYVAGGKEVSLYFDGRVCGNKPASAEMYNEETNTWSVVKKKFIPDNNLNAIEVEGRVYFIINKFPIDSGIRTTDRRLYSAVLNERENLRKIDNIAALGYMVIKRKSDE